ncbi:MAG: hypothetical protein HY692_09575 [Cyanobacteria bacterium NC_groundwater_1444_Ag_S-0.65um_54_12]|nr:hypothetical protein [Cyanobacteria bacterium NC_groundwater_1444_Ag_S-0.65um_54_12]
MTAIEKYNQSFAKTNLPRPGNQTIGPGMRVLHIGDSHTVGVYGHEMDQLLRKTGATVATYASAGSAPSWWLNGTVTRSGYLAKDEYGNVDQPTNWREPRVTPKLTDLIRRFQPNILVVSLGANLINSGEDTVVREVARFLEIAQREGIRVMWVGPPVSRGDGKAKDLLYQQLRKAVGPDMVFVDSRRFTHYPSDGGDGIHYGGAQGGAIARQWALKVYNALMSSGQQATDR